MNKLGAQLTDHATPAQDGLPAWPGAMRQRQAARAAFPVRIPLGDISSGRLRSLADVTERVGAGVRFTPAQGILLVDVPESEADHVAVSLRDGGFQPPSAASIVRCAGTDTCTVGVTRVLGLAALLPDLGVPQRVRPSSGRGDRPAGGRKERERPAGSPLHDPPRWRRPGGRSGALRDAHRPRRGPPGSGSCGASDDASRQGRGGGRERTGNVYATREGPVRGAAEGSPGGTPGALRRGGFLRPGGYLHRGVPRRQRGSQSPLNLRPPFRRMHYFSRLS
ncbi:MAG: hypothetical protein B7Z62_09145 [Deltaproteobacteria bacterium 37-65-8]|nr:MAG: hypothetical protein B7Z62_09145 [Deltaproteobacteria bacterium 37-65-8]